VPSSADLARNASLHLGNVDVDALPRWGERLLRGARVPPTALRGVQRVAMKVDRLDWERSWLARLVDLRRELLGSAADGPPRFLVRVDEFPYYTSFDRPADLDMSRRFHDVMAEAGLPHLMSALPQLTHDPLDPTASGGRPLGEREIELFARMRRDGVTFAQHGNSHRTRFASPRRRSELCGLASDDAEALLEDGRRRLAAAGVSDVRVFVPPFNRFDASQYALLARRFDVVCGGPESVALMGFHGGPLWRGDAVYLPCYSPLYADARTVLPAAERLVEAAPGTWVPIVLHTSWEQDDDFAALGALARRIAPYAASWEELLGALDDSAPAGASHDAATA
jgi:hypothetical protein